MTLEVFVTESTEWRGGGRGSSGFGAAAMTSCSWAWERQDSALRAHNDPQRRPTPPFKGTSYLNVKQPCISLQRGFSIP